jgi:Xaa-Pro aminopeptidase
MYPHQAERLTGALEQAGLDALVATTPANVAYLTGFRGAANALLASPPLGVFGRDGTALVVPAREVAAVVADGLDVDHVVCVGAVVPALAEPADVETRRIRDLMTTGADGPAGALAAALAALGVGAGVIGLDDGRLTPGGWQHLTAGLHRFRVVPAGDLLLGARRVKGPWEIDCLAHAIRIAEEALNVVLQLLKPGVTEREAVTAYRVEVVKREATPGPAIIATGPRGGIPTAAPTERALRARDVVRFDVGCRYKGYCASVGRTAVMGEPDARQETVYGALEAGLAAGIDAARPGSTAARVFEAGVEATRSAGLPAFRPGDVGSGIGLEPCERPTLASGDTTVLEAGEVVGVDLPYLELGWAGLQVKDTVLVTRTGAHVLNRSSRGLVVLD